jgi:hypothetical protein
MTHRSRRQVMGYVDYGSAAIPPLPDGVVLTDRDDGTLWLVSHDMTVPDAMVTITDTWPTRLKVSIYPANEGPYIGPNAMLFVRGGLLGIDIALERHSGVVFSRKHGSRVAGQLKAAQGYDAHENLTWEPVEY